MNNKAVFLDRDGTINVEKNYLYKREEFEFLPGALDGMRMLCESGFQLIVITNQSGIARGLYTETDFIKLTEYIKDRCIENGVYLTDTFYCPHYPYSTISKYRKQCNCRKPKTGLFERAIDAYDIDLSHSYAIGDKLRDLSICTKSECKGFLIDDHEEQGTERNVRIVTSLYEAAQIIVCESEKNTLS